MALKKVPRFTTIEMVGLSAGFESFKENFGIQRNFIRIEENEEIRKALAMPNCFQIMFNSIIVDSSDTPSKLNMSEVEQVLILSEMKLVSILSPHNPHRTVAPRDVIIIAENEYGGDVRFSWEDLDLSMTVGELKYCPLFKTTVCLRTHGKTSLWFIMKWFLMTRMYWHVLG